MTDPARTGSGDSGGRSPVLEIHDVELLRQAALEAGWSAEYRQLGAGPLTVRSTVVQCAGISMVAQIADRSMEFVGRPPAGVLTVMIPGPGDDFWINGYSLNDNELIVLAPGIEVYSVIRFAITACAVHIPESLINASAGHLKPPWDNLERGWVVSVPARTGVLKSFRGLVGSADPISSRDAELESVLTRGIIPMICESPNAGPTKDRFGRARRWQLLSRARAYIESQLSETVRMNDVYERAGASARTVERAFQQELQMTPSAYVRVCRLNAVKREIVGLGETDKSITEIAMSHGFGHIGRFSAAYREHFGHSPSEARRRIASWPGEWTS